MLNEEYQEEERVKEKEGYRREDYTAIERLVVSALIYKESCRLRSRRNVRG